MLNFVIYFLNILGSIATALLIVLLARLSFVALRYWNTSRKISSRIHRHQLTLPIASFFDTEKGKYENLFWGLFDSDGIPFPAVNQGPHIDGTAFISISNPQAIRQVLSNPQIFIKMPPTYRLTEELIGHGIVTQKGEEWKRNRGIISPVFNYRSLKLQVPIMGNIASEMCEMLRGRSPDEEISAHFIRDWTMKVLVAIAFGNSFDSEWLAHIFRDLLKAFNGIAITTTLFGFLSPIVGYPFHRRMSQVRGAIKDRIKEAVQTRRKELKWKKRVKDGEGVEDLISLLLRSGIDFPENALMDQGLTFLFAGFETTSLLLQWTLYFLVRHPEVQTKIRKEVEEVLQGDPLPLNSHIGKLQYTRATLQESLRMRPPVPFLDRLAVDDFDLVGDIHVPKDTSVMIFFHTTNFDPRIWKDPKLFLPERFLEKEEEHAFAFMPFSAGSRNCLGQKVAMQEATIFLATLVRNFELRAKDTSQVKMVNNPLLEPHNLYLSFHPIAEPFHSS